MCCVLYVVCCMLFVVWCVVCGGCRLMLVVVDGGGVCLLCVV